MIHGHSQSRSPVAIIEFSPYSSKHASENQSSTHRAIGTRIGRIAQVVAHQPIVTWWDLDFTRVIRNGRQPVFVVGGRGRGRRRGLTVMYWRWRETGSMQTLSPGTPMTRLQTSFEGSEGDTATTRSPEPSLEKRCVKCSYPTMSPVMFRVGSMEGPKH